MSRRDTQLLIEDILEAANRILSYTKGLSFEDFTADQKTVDAVARNFEIIGEAASRLPEQFKSKHPEINWIDCLIDSNVKPNQRIRQHMQKR
jgi:uncharacterized protein with HEPN domain